MASQESVLACGTCGLAQRVEELQPGTTAECIRCGSSIMSRPWTGVQTTAALTIAALVLYVPANIYPILRMNETPAVEVHIVQSSEPPGRMGEAGTSAIVPAVANAMFAATGKRLRNLPIDTNALKQPA